MIEPNWGLMLWLILAMWVFSALFGLAVAAVSWGEERRYGWADVMSTTLTVVFVMAVLLT